MKSPSNNEKEEGDKGQGLTKKSITMCENPTKGTTEKGKKWEPTEEEMAKQHRNCEGGKRKH